MSNHILQRFQSNPRQPSNPRFPINENLNRSQGNDGILYILSSKEDIGKFKTVSDEEMIEEFNRSNEIRTALLNSQQKKKASFLASSKGGDMKATRSTSTQPHRGSASSTSRSQSVSSSALKRDAFGEHSKSTARVEATAAAPPPPRRNSRSENMTHNSLYASSSSPPSPKPAKPFQKGGFGVGQSASGRLGSSVELIKEKFVENLSVIESMFAEKKAMEQRMQLLESALRRQSAVSAAAATTTTAASAGGGDTAVMYEEGDDYGGRRRGSHHRYASTVPVEVVGQYSPGSPADKEGEEEEEEEGGKDSAPPRRWSKDVDTSAIRSKSSGRLSASQVAEEFEKDFFYGERERERGRSSSRRSLTQQQRSHSAPRTSGLARASTTSSPTSLAGGGDRGRERGGSRERGGGVSRPQSASSASMRSSSGGRLADKLRGVETRQSADGRMKGLSVQLEADQERSLS